MNKRVKLVTILLYCLENNFGAFGRVLIHVFAYLLAYRRFQLGPQYYVRMLGLSNDNYYLKTRNDEYVHIYWYTYSKASTGIRMRYLCLTVYCGDVLFC